MKRPPFLFVLLLVLAFFTTANSQPTLSSESQKAMVLTNLSAMPLAFTENRGQWDEKALFKAVVGAATFWFCQDEVAYVFARDTNELINNGEPQGPEMPGIPDKFDRPRYKKESLVIKAQFIGANPEAEIVAENRLSHNNNYFLGNNPSRWATDVPNYSAVTYRDIYPGIDLKYHGNGHGMKYDFIVNPGADISQIRIRYDGVEELSVTANGDLEVQTSFGPIHENIPSVYQETAGGMREMRGRYIIPEPGMFGFEVEGYNPSLPLVIDPELLYSTYLGGGGNDQGYGIAVDGSGCAYVTGETGSTDFPTVNPYDGIQNGSYDVFVTKFSAAGNSLLYSTYLGGGGDDQGYGIAVDGSGCAYVTGYTSSTDFPTVNPYDGSYNGGSYDVFVAEFSPAGNSLLYSTYLGGSGDDCGYADSPGIAVDYSGCAYVIGYTGSTNFPMVSPYDGSYNGGVEDVFVTKFSPAGSSLIYSTYLGGSSNERGVGIAVDDSGCAYCLTSDEIGQIEGLN